MHFINVHLAFVLLTDVPQAQMQAGGYVPPALTLTIPGYDISGSLTSIH